MKQPSPLWLFILLLHPPVTTPCGTYFGSAAYQVHAPTPSTVAIRAGPTPVLDSSVDSSTNKFGYTLRFYEASNGEFFYRIKNTLPLQGCTENCIQFFSKKQNDDLIMKENEYQGACFQYEQDPDSNFALSLGIPDTASKSFVQFDNTDLRFEKGPSFPVFWWMLPMKQNGAGSAISPLQVAFEIQCRRKRNVYSYGNSGRRYSTTHTRRRTSRRNINGRQGSSRNRNIQHPTRGTSHRNSNNNNRNNNRNNNNNNNRNNNNNNNRNNSRNNNRNNSRNKNMMVSSGCGTEENVAVHNIVRGGRAATLDTIKFRSNVSNPSEFFPASTQFDIKQFITYNTPLFYDRRRKQYFLTAYETVAIRIPNSPWYLEVEEATQPGRQSREAEDESTVKPPSRLTNFRRTTGTPLQLSYSPIGFGRYEGNLRRETKCTRQFGCQKTPSVTGVNLTAQQHVDRRMFLVHRIGDKVRFESILSPGVFLAFLKRRNDEKLVATRLHNDKSLMFDFNADRFPRLQGRPLKVNVTKPSRPSQSRNNRQRRRGQGYRG